LAAIACVLAVAAAVYKRAARGWWLVAGLQPVRPPLVVRRLTVKICDGVVTNRLAYLAIGVDCESAKQALSRDYCALPCRLRAAFWAVAPCALYTAFCAAVGRMVLPVWG
jgi:hypothetical protein